MMGNPCEIGELNNSSESDNSEPYDFESEWKRFEIPESNEDYTSAYSIISSEENNTPREQNQPQTLPDGFSWEPKKIARNGSQKKSSINLQPYN